LQICTDLVKIIFTSSHPPPLGAKTRKNPNITILYIF